MGVAGEVIPVAPATALNLNSPGKQPACCQSTGDWTAVHGWGDLKPNIQTWSQWPEHNIGLRTRYHPSIDVDIDDPALAKWVGDVVRSVIGPTATRSRNNSPRIVLITKLAEGELLQSKRKIILDHGAIELLGDGQQVVVSGKHPSGADQSVSGEITTVTVAQLDDIWKRLIQGLGGRVTKLTGGGASTPNSDGGQLVIHTDDSVVNITAASQYITDQPAALNGHRNDSCYKIVAHLRQYHALSQTVCASLMTGYAGLDAKEITAVVNSVYRGNTQAGQGEGHPATVGFGSADLPVGASREPVTIEHMSNAHGPSNDTVKYKISQPLAFTEFDPQHLKTTSKPKATQANFDVLMHRYDIHIAYNVVAKDVIIAGAGMNQGTDNSGNANLSTIHSICGLNDFATGFIEHGVTSQADRHQFNPVAQWIHSVEWDGVSRIEQLFNTLTLAPDQNRETACMMFRKWLIGTVSIVQEKIERFEYVLVLQSEAGGEGKTSWFKSLCPSDWILDGHILDTADKDSIKKALSYWIVELGELDSTFKAADVKRLMAYLSNGRDEIRLPYARLASIFARRTSHGASVNSSNFLQDDSGDRRFWPISVTALDYNHDIDMQQLWAEVDGLEENHWLDRMENRRVIEYNKNFKAVDPVNDALDSYFANDAVVGEVHLTVSEICTRAGIDRLNKSTLNKAGSYLRGLGYKPCKSCGKRGYRVPNYDVFST